jgi:hypothetical protein
MSAAIPVTNAWGSCDRQVGSWGTSGNTAPRTASRSVRRRGALPE